MLITGLFRVKYEEKMATYDEAYETCKEVNMTLPDWRFIDSRDVRYYFDYSTFEKFFTAYNATMINGKETSKHLQERLNKHSFISLVYVEPIF